MQTRSVKCKLQVPKELRQDIDITLERFADACNLILDVAKEAKQWNRTKLHHLVKGKSYRNGKKFKCGHCGFEHDADVNAAKNIAALGLSVSQPESPGMTCQLQGQLAWFGGTFDRG